MQEGPGRRCARLSFVVVSVLLLAVACGGAGTPASPRPGLVTPTIAPSAAGPTATPGTATSPGVPGSLDELIAFAESLAPPDGTERPRVIGESAIQLRWATTAGLATVSEHYGRLADRHGFVALGGTDGLTTAWAFQGGGALPAGGTIQLTRIGPGEVLVVVTVSTGQ